MHDGFLTYKKFKFLKLASAVCLSVFIAYFFHKPIDEPNGGTWLGYVLGTIGALLIVWLMALGIRKRRYGANFNLSAWVSAHVYLGLSLIVIATLHTGFQFGWNIHTLAYVLMMVVILSGAFGIYAYTRFPKLMTENRRAASRDELLFQVGEIDSECKKLMMRLPNNVSDVMLKATEETKLGGTIFQILSGRDKTCASVVAFERLQTLVGDVDDQHTQKTRQSMILMGKKCFLLNTLRRDIQVKALLDIWLSVHVPMSIALIVALIIHVFSVFYYW